MPPLNSLLAEALSIVLRATGLFSVALSSGQHRHISAPSAASRKGSVQLPLPLLPVSFTNQPLVSVFPYGQLDFEEVYVTGPERGHQSVIGPT